MNEIFDDKLLILRSGHWYYQRRVPKKYRNIDPRRLIRKSLGTASIEIARLRRNAMIEADDAYWTILSLEASDSGDVSTTTRTIENERYRAATARALVHGFTYRRVDNRLANIAAGFGSSTVAPKGFVCHHAENAVTMQLIPTSVHNLVKHTGGAAVIKNGGFD